jgi:hypothetical protein
MAIGVVCAPDNDASESTSTIPSNIDRSGMKFSFLKL